MTTATEYVELKKNIELYEGNIEHMYLDSNGFVTVGVGHMIPNASKAAKLTFYVTKTAVLATEEHLPPGSRSFRARFGSLCST